jgi:phosphoglycolate phosphatase-like HAD superfamily hydrolase
MRRFTVLRATELKVPADVPDLFLAAAERLGADITDAVVVGDSVWDLLAARRARPPGDRAAVGRLRPGGAGAGRRLPRLRGPGGPACHLDEVGVRTPTPPTG